MAVVSPSLDKRHGTERAVTEQVVRLAQQYGFEIHLYSQQVSERALDAPDATASSCNVTWHKVPRIPGPHLLQFLCWLICNSFLRKWSVRHADHSSKDIVLSAGINCFDADIIIVHVLFHRLRELSRASIQNGLAGASLVRRLHRRMYYSLMSALERRIYRNPNVSLAAVSGRTAAALAQYFNRRNVPIIPNGVDHAEFNLSARLTRRAAARARRNFNEQDFVLLMIGNDWRVKGLPLILFAMAALPHLPLRMLVAGDDDSSPFRRKAALLGIADRCTWESPRTEVIDLYAAADVYVSPTLEDSFGLPVLEAMGCGLPAITSVFAGAADLIRSEIDGFILSDPDDPGPLTQLLQRLYEDESYRLRIGAAAARTAQEWTWDRSAEALRCLLEEVVARKKDYHSN